MIIELKMADPDRKELGGPEWLPLDIDRLLDTPADKLIRWESEAEFAIERAISELNGGRPTASAVLVLLWIARKQGGDLAGGQLDDGTPEPYARLESVRTLRVSIRKARVQAESGDVDPPVRSSED